MSAEPVVTVRRQNPEAHNETECLDASIQWLGCMLRNMAEDALEISIIGEPDADPDTIISRYRRYVKDAVNYLAGAHLCDKFQYGYLNLDKFCSEMVDGSLKHMLSSIYHLPDALAVKYDLNSTNKSNDDGCTDGGNSTVDGETTSVSTSETETVSTPASDIGCTDGEDSTDDDDETTSVSTSETQTVSTPTSDSVDETDMGANGINSNLDHMDISYTN